MKRKIDNTDGHQYNLSFDVPQTETPESRSTKAGDNETMTKEEKYIHRIIFQNKIYNADGQKFEDIFTDIMRYAEPEFRQIKPYGRAGDKKNDGYIKSKGIYFQVYGPEDIASSIPYAKRKLEEDLSGLLQEWNSINEFYFIINDKFKGIPPDLEIEVNKQITENNLKGGVRGAAYLENLLFALEDNQILKITGPVPDPSRIRTLDYSMLNEVINYIMGIPLMKTVSSDMSVPDWDGKIKFNGLSKMVAQLLNSGSIQIASLNEYLMNHGNFLADGLRNKINEIYVAEREYFTGDDLFLRIVTVASPREEQAYQSAVIVIMAKYFEACDIFERPPEDYP
ncbi:MAG: hypothetical protein LBE13_01440 [Bacteroidales bacterium]|jgi:hypothetical protein|nr:hypothetical protein [Bacteroidales bacterium]